MTPGAPDQPPRRGKTQQEHNGTQRRAMWLITTRHNRHVEGLVVAIEAELNLKTYRNHR